jgi:hypothetical protein
VLLLAGLIDATLGQQQQQQSSESTPHQLEPLVITGSNEDDPWPEVVAGTNAKRNGHARNGDGSRTAGSALPPFLFAGAPQGQSLHSSSTKNDKYVEFFSSLFPLVLVLFSFVVFLFSGYFSCFYSFFSLGFISLCFIFCAMQ